MPLRLLYFLYYFCTVFTLNSWRMFLMYLDTTEISHLMIYSFYIVSLTRIITAWLWSKLGAKTSEFVVVGDILDLSTIFTWMPYLHCHLWHIPIYSGSHWYIPREILFESCSDIMIPSKFDLLTNAVHIGCIHRTKKFCLTQWIISTIKFIRTESVNS
jgi:hypothetical protein